MPEEKNIIEKIALGATGIIFNREPGWSGKLEQFLLTELKALKDEVLGEVTKYNELNPDDLPESGYEADGWNNHRRHTEKAFERFGIK
jgi:hypothetical protein